MIFRKLLESMEHGLCIDFMLEISLRGKLLIISIIIARSLDDSTVMIVNAVGAAACRTIGELTNINIVLIR